MDCCFSQYISKQNLAMKIKNGRINLKLLADSDLSRTNLSKKDLRGANLKGSTLNGIYLQGANLQGANLQGANLKGANLKGANLTYVDFTGADLRGAVLKDATMDKTVFIGADLSYANLTNARINTDTNFTNATMMNIIISDNRFHTARVTGASVKVMTFCEKFMYWFGCFGDYRDKSLKTVVPFNTVVVDC
jgi:uncharacterized protein YjbI with pentapeptide repeats